MSDAPKPTALSDEMLERMRASMARADAIIEQRRAERRDLYRCKCAERGVSEPIDKSNAEPV